MSAASVLHSSLLQAVSAVMLWLVHVQKVPRASEHLCPAKLQKGVICAVLASLSSRSFPLTLACPGHRSLCSRRLFMAVCQTGQPIPDSTFCSRFIECTGTIIFPKTSTLISPQISTIIFPHTDTIIFPRVSTIIFLQTSVLFPQTSTIMITQTGTVISP